MLASNIKVSVQNRLKKKVILNIEDNSNSRTMASAATKKEDCSDTKDYHEDFEGLESSDLEDVEKNVLVLMEKRGNDFFLLEENLKKLLTNNEVRNINVCVISIAGGMRMGKSFLLNLILLYFEREGWKTDSDDWLKKNSDEIINSHFSWSNGSPGHTQGIIAWGKPIIVEKDDGTKMAIILLDTQGNFSHGEEKIKNAQVFALSTLLSSLQIINMFRQVGSHDIEHLQTFVEFSKAPNSNQSLDVDGNQNGNTNFFQDLVFLVRDWDFDDYEFGNVGGKAYLRSSMIPHVTDGEPIVIYLENAFEKIDCYLMPSPKRAVRRASNTDKIRISEIGEEFLKHVVKFIHEFLNPEKLKMKTIGFSAQVTGKNLFEYITACAEKILSEDGPEMLTEIRALAEYNNNKCKQQVIDWYRQHTIERVEDIETWDEYEKVLTEAKETARNRFLDKLWFGNFGSSIETCLDPSYEDVDARTYLLMRQRRDDILESTIEEWLARSINEVKTTRFILKSYDEYLKDLVSVDELRDPDSAIDRRKKTIEKFKYTYKGQGKICIVRGTFSVATTCAMVGAAIVLEPLVITTAIVGCISTGISFLVSGKEKVE